MIFKRILLSLAVSIAVCATAVSANPQQNNQNNSKNEHQDNSKIQHVLLISVDGMHQNDLDWCVANNECPTLAKMVKQGVAYSNAQTPFPSDSFPGMVAQTTGGNPASTGIYYDDSYSRALLPNGTINCNGKIPGAEVYYAEVIEKSTPAGDFILDAFQGIPNLYPVPDFTPGDLTSVPTNILQLVGSPDDVRKTLIDPANLPVDPTTCAVVYPYQYMQVNTIFEVAHAKGLRTAWTDKHPAYEILNGPSGYGIDDLFAPEINSLVDNTVAGGPDWTKDNTNTQQYDSFKVLSIINEINGFDHSGKNNMGTPAIFGMNFQAVSTGQKLPASTTPESNTEQSGGYQTVTVGKNTVQVPGPVLVSALNFVDKSLQQFIDALEQNPATQGNTAIIVSAKHGQSPQDKSTLTLINDGDMINALNTAWNGGSPALVAHAIDDDGILMWFSDRSPQAIKFAKNFLLDYNGTGLDVNGYSKPFKSAGVDAIYAGKDAAKFIGVSSTDQRVPDLIGIAHPGSVYAGSKVSKIAEHGGDAKADRHVPILVWGTGKQAKSINAPVETKQIAPTILNLLGINPNMLQAVQIENTKVLPGSN